MQSSAFEGSLKAAVEATGQPYLLKRQEILDAADDTLPLLQATKSPTDWKTALVVEAMTGWITNRESYEQCHEFVQGNLPGPKPITGKFTARHRADAIAAQGVVVVPALLETVVKTRQHPGGDEQAAIFGALGELKDPRAVPPLIEMLAAEDPAMQRRAAGTLGKIGDARAVGPLLEVLGDTAAAEPLRASAAESLGVLAAPRAREPLERALIGRESGDDLRKACVRALTALGDTASSPALVQALEEGGDLIFLMVVIEALGAIGDEKAAVSLTRFESHADEYIADAARDARARIGNR